MHLPAQILSQPLTGLGKTQSIAFPVWTIAMPAPAANRATDPAAAAASPPSGAGGPKINPLTGLSTDYLNHFTEAVMVLELAGAMPECVEDLRTWQPKTYAGHFAASRFSNREAILAAYRAADPAVRGALDRNAEVVNALAERSRDLVCQQTDRAEIGAIARRAVERLRPLIARTAAVINGTPGHVTGRQGPQAAIDAMFAR
jgi:hypothetical protein